MKTLKLVFAGLMLFLASTAAHSAIWTDLWYNPNENGWGVNIIQQNNVLFITLFVYGTDGRSRFYVASGAVRTGTVYTGDLYETNGPFFGGAFNPSTVGVRRVGSMTFTPVSSYTGTLTYSVDGVSVSKSIQRQTWTHITLSGRFRGSMVVMTSSAGCSAIAANTVGNVTDIGLNVTANTTNSSVTLALTNDSGQTLCTFSGTYTQFGSLYRHTTTNTGCTGTWTFNDYVVDDDAISGNVGIVNGSCSVGLNFGLVRLP